MNTWNMNLRLGTQMICSQKSFLSRGFATTVIKADSNKPDEERGEHIQPEQDATQNMSEDQRKKLEAAEKIFAEHLVGGKRIKSI